jgi:glycosyltransferase involved in cell wall biosynthesis
MAYFNRERMVQRALESVKMSFGDWQAIFVDDGSAVSGEEIVRLTMPDEYRSGRIKCYNTGDSIAIKTANKGSRLGEFWNAAMYESDADIAIMLCDDDALFYNYIPALAEYYKSAPHVNYSYSHLAMYNPAMYYESLADIPIDLEFFNTPVSGMDSPLNIGPMPMNPYHRLDSSQVSWRIKPVIEAGIKFPARQTADLDASLYSQLFENFGVCLYNGLISQFKGWHQDQMGNRRDDLYGLQDE